MLQQYANMLLSKFDCVKQRLWHSDQHTFFSSNSYNCVGSCLPLEDESVLQVITRSLDYVD